MEDCTITTETIGGVHHTYYTKDGVIVAECRKSIEYARDVEYWYHNNRLHRVDGPAVICHKNGQIEIEFWYRDGERHRDDGPASIHYETDQIFVEHWYCYGKQHRDDGPAGIYYYNGRISAEWWYHDGERHRDDGPARIYYKNGQIIEEYWYRHDKKHRDDCLPALICYENDQITEEWWYRDDKLCPVGVLASVVYQNIDLVIGRLIEDKHIENIDEFRDMVRGDAIHQVLRPLPIPIRDAITAHYCYQ